MQLSDSQPRHVKGQTLNGDGAVKSLEGQDFQANSLAVLVALDF